MDFKSFLENTLHSDQNVEIRDALLAEIPKRFVHYVDSMQTARHIAISGFSPANFNKTASPATQYDPEGIYAFKYDNNIVQKPHVVFDANLTKAIMLIDKANHQSNAKEMLSLLFNRSNGNILSNQLKRLGYQAVLRPNGEQIIIDLNVVSKIHPIN